MLRLRLPIIFETPKLDHGLLLFFWLAERNVHGPKMGKLGGAELVVKHMSVNSWKNSTSTRCGDFEMSTTKNWCIYIYRYDMYIHIMFNFRYTPKSCRPPNLPISEKIDSTYDGSDRP